MRFERECPSQVNRVKVCRKVEHRDECSGSYPNGQFSKRYNRVTCEASRRIKVKHSSSEEGRNCGGSLIFPLLPSWQPMTPQGPQASKLPRCRSPHHRQETRHAPPPHHLHPGAPTCHPRAAAAVPTFPTCSRATQPAPPRPNHNAPPDQARPPTRRARAKPRPCKSPRSSPT